LDARPTATDRGDSGMTSAISKSSKKGWTVRIRRRTRLLLSRRLRTARAGIPWSRFRSARLGARRPLPSGRWRTARGRSATAAAAYASLPAVPPLSAFPALSPDAADHYRLRLRIPARRRQLGRRARPESRLAYLSFRGDSGADASSGDGGFADRRAAGCAGSDCGPGRRNQLCRRRFRHDRTVRG
jgi:hypothetical protein